jgi:hypothetical protein
MGEAQEAARVLQWAIDISQSLKPPWWRLGQRRYWRLLQQPIDVIQAFRAASRGEHDPLKSMGIVIKIEEE